MAAEMLFDNDRVRVTRVRHKPGEVRPPAARNDRLIIYLTEGHVRRTEGGRSQEIRHRAGEVAWRDRSEHEIENLGETSQDVLIVEFKR
jgi:quercetin dioxygenase-like cupin family protein